MPTQTLLLRRDNCPESSYFINKYFKKLIMKSLLIFSLLIATAVAQQKYTSQYDNVNVDEILQNRRILTNYIKCMLDKGPCTAAGTELKKTLPDALKTECSKCDEKQKEVAEKVINHLRTQRPDDWNKLIAKYDPEGQYQKRFEAQGLRRH